MGQTGLLYASLQLADRKPLQIPEIHRKQVRAALKRYPRECAAILAFDCWVGNDDRRGNLKAVVDDVPFSIFRAYDHETALLGAVSPAEERIEELARGEFMGDSHLFANAFPYDAVEPWVGRIQGLSRAQVEDCCQLGEPLHLVSEKLQKDLTGALWTRRDKLPALLASITRNKAERP